MLRCEWEERKENKEAYVGKRRWLRKCFLLYEFFKAFEDAQEIFTEAQTLMEQF